MLKSFTGRAQAIFGRQECDKRYHLKVQFLAVEFLFLLLCVLFYTQGERGRGEGEEGERGGRERDLHNRQQTLLPIVCIYRS